MRKRKVGIITLYYNNNNYGGIAQAYALQKYLENLGCETKLISFSKNKVKKSLRERIKKRLNIKNGVIGFIKGTIWIFRWGVKDIIIKKLNKISFKKYQSDMEKRREAMGRFREIIPHTDVYTIDNIEQCVLLFDIFVSGSDQIWKPGVVQGPFVLDFVPPEKRKVSYASSVTSTNISDDKKYCQFMQANLQDYYDISVREAATQKELSAILGREVKHVVDPTLLLSRDEWECVAGERMIQETYIFAYFLGDSPSQKRYVESIAKNNNLKIVNLPFAAGEYNKSDCRFGDYKLYNVGVPEFFSLIKYAEVVFTDSFHAVCFSWNFKTKFFVFDRNVGFDGTNMSSRIESILDMMNLKNRKIDVSDCIDLFEEIIFQSEDLDEKISYSKQYIQNFLE